MLMDHLDAAVERFDDPIVCGGSVRLPDGLLRSGQGRRQRCGLAKTHLTPGGAVVRIGCSLPAGIVTVGNRKYEADETLRRLLPGGWRPAATRHVDAGDPEAIDATRHHGFGMPSLTGNGGSDR
jgi:hypothetical protein